jgi:hypothetical protein
MPNIAMLEAHDYVDVTTTAQGDRVTGAVTARHGGDDALLFPSVPAGTSGKCLCAIRRTTAR